VRGAIPPLPQTPSWSGAQLKHRDNFYLTLPLPRLIFCVILISLVGLREVLFHDVSKPTDAAFRINVLISKRTDEGK
jgi:hypothetical protein